MSSLFVLRCIFGRNPIEIKQFSYANEKYPFAILWAMEWLYSQDALNNYTIHVPVSGFSEKDFAGELRLKSMTQKYKS